MISRHIKSNSLIAETEGTGISMAETEGTDISMAETEGTDITNQALNVFFRKKIMLAITCLLFFSQSLLASELQLHTTDKDVFKGIWLTDSGISFVEGYQDRENITLFVKQTLLGDKATENGTGRKATENGTGRKATENGTGRKATENGTGNKATENGTGNKATENGTGNKILSVNLNCSSARKYSVTVESENGENHIQAAIDSVTINGKQLSCK